MITIEINERKTPALRRLLVEADGWRVSDAIGQAVVGLLREHFRSLPANKHGFPSTGFWQRAAAATRYDVTLEGPQVSVNQTGIRQRLFGGVITAVRRKFLTIPAIAETYGHQAREFGGLKVCRTSYHDRLALGLAPAEIVAPNPGYVAPESVWFFLRRAVRQEPNPDVLPRDFEITDAALEAASNAISK